jgi:hypothetical protein
MADRYKEVDETENDFDIEVLNVGSAAKDKKYRQLFEETCFQHLEKCKK